MQTFQLVFFDFSHSPLLQIFVNMCAFSPNENIKYYKFVLEMLMSMLAFIGLSKETVHVQYLIFRLVVLVCQITIQTIIFQDMWYKNI